MKEKNNTKKKYPFNEGEPYWTIENDCITCSFWNHESEKNHDKHPNKKYFNSEQEVRIEFRNI